MPRFLNGQIPYSELVKFGEGLDPVTGTWEWWLPPATLARWRMLVAIVEERHGVTLRITPGWNCYRPLEMQTAYKAHFTSIGQPLLAATPSTSPHGGSWRGGDTMCIDVQNWAAIPWPDFKAACEEAGFAVDQVTPRELWHITDYHPWEMPEGDDDMYDKDAEERLFAKIEFEARPFRKYQWGTGIIIVSPTSGKVYAARSAGEVTQLETLGLVSTEVTHVLPDDQFKITETLLRALGTSDEGFVALSPEDAKEIIAAISSDVVDQVREIIESAPAAQLDGIASAVADVIAKRMKS